MGPLCSHCNRQLRGTAYSHYKRRTWRLLASHSNRYGGPYLPNIIRSYGVPCLAVIGGRNGGRYLAIIIGSYGMPCLAVIRGRHGDRYLAIIIGMESPVLPS
jgi:hypothetical protein